MTQQKQEDKDMTMIIDYTNVRTSLDPEEGALDVIKKLEGEESELVGQTAGKGLYVRFFEVDGKKKLAITFSEENIRNIKR